MTDFNTWKESMNKKFNDEIKGPEQINNVTIKDKVFSQSIRIETDVIDFDIHARLLPRHRRKIAQYQTVEDAKDYDGLQDSMASILSELVIEKTLDKEFWLSLDEETGMLPEIFGIVSQKMSEAEESALTFRKD